MTDILTLGISSRPD